MLAAQMEQHLESVVSHAGRVFYDQGSERMTHPCAPVKLHAAMHVALQQRRIEPLRSIIHPMRCVLCSQHCDALTRATACQCGTEPCDLLCL